MHRPKHHHLAILGGFHGYSHICWSKWKLPTTLALSTCQESKYYPLSMSHTQTLLSALLYNSILSEIRKKQWIHTLLHSNRSKGACADNVNHSPFYVNGNLSDKDGLKYSPPPQLTGLIKRKSSNFTMFMFICSKTFFLLSWNPYSIYSASLRL